VWHLCVTLFKTTPESQIRLEIWANAQHYGRPAKHRWRPLFNATNFGWHPPLDAVQWCCQDAKLVEICRVPQTTDRSQPLVGRSLPYYEDMWRTYCCLTRYFFAIVDTCRSCEDIARQTCAMVPRWRFVETFLRPVFSASRVQHVSDLHLKFALMPHHVCKYGRHPLCDGWD